MEDFVNASVALYNNKKAWEHAQMNGSSLLKKYNAKTLGDRLIEKIQHISKNLEKHRLNNFTGAMLQHHSMQSTKYMSQWIEEKNKRL